ncbi:MAG: hypothetical protein IJP47_00750 [Prevotella sp.]|nr:hypothetical protein [Prevotella sp.]
MENKEKTLVEYTLDKKVEDIGKERMHEAFESSKIISDTMRYLTLSGVVVAWVLKKEYGDSQECFYSFFYISIAVFIINLFLDTFYNLYRMNVYMEYSQDSLRKENPPENPTKVEEIINRIPKSVEINTRVFWYLRIFIMIIGYLIILMPLMCRHCQ